MRPRAASKGRSSRREVSPSGRVAERSRSSAAHVRSILDNTLDAVIALDAAGRVTFWNPQAEHTFGVPRKGAIGRALGEVILPEAERGVFARTLARLGRAEGEPHLRLEMEARRGEGGALPPELTLHPRPDRGPPGLSALARDITRRKHHHPAR